MYTKTFAVNAIGDPEEVTVTTHCNKVWIFEGPDPNDPGSWTGATTAWEFKAEEKRGGPVPTWVFKDQGFSQVFEEKVGAQCYLPGQRIAYIRTISGATYFHQYEE